VSSESPIPGDRQLTTRLLDRAGSLLRASDTKADEIAWANEVLDRWRGSHSFPLNTVEMVLRSKVRQAGLRADFARRLKRRTSVIDKLRRYSTMNLSRMHDIGGCRAVVETLADVDGVRRRYEGGWSKQDLTREYDYIANPKPDGYRSLHLVFTYRSRSYPALSGRRIEVQIRTQLQHAWASAVEVVDAGSGQNLKSGSGDPKWARFFALASAFFAAREDTPSPLQAEGDADLRSAISSVARDLQVRERLHAYRAAFREIDQTSGRATSFLLILRKTGNEAFTLSINPFKTPKHRKGLGPYMQTELALDTAAGDQVVVVSAESVSALRSAFPNYFLDTQVFLDGLKEVL
jgi:putative GTP pyrophosphokinase